jgi:hypothetical protein
MSQNFKLNFDEMQEDSLADVTGNNANSNDLYETPGHVRNLCFVWPNGRMDFFNYAYLITGEFDNEEQTIKLTYTTHIVILKGIELIKLFEMINHHQVKKIVSIDERYKTINEQGDWMVYSIEISS